ncbi:MAG TPA: carbon storage regulator [Pseudomonas sp.]|nr:carbon storage regulator [Pseudomonas sp.]
MQSTLRIDLKPGESVTIGDVATITLEEKSGKAARIVFKADRSVPIQKVRHPTAAQSLRNGLAAIPA